jgi:hypothetical protein
MDFLQENELSIRSIIEAGDIVSTHYDDQPAVGRYQGNGRFGCVFSKLGLHAHPREQSDYDLFGKTQYMHIKHWGRFNFYSENMQADTSADYLLPLLKIYWEHIPNDIGHYSQTQSFYAGTLTTKYTCDEENEISVLSWFDQENKNLSAFHFNIEKNSSPIIISPEADFIPYPLVFKNRAHQCFNITREGNQWRIEITCIDAVPRKTSNIYIFSNADVQICQEGLRILPAKGITELYLSYDEAVNLKEAATSLIRTKQYWHHLWEKSGWLKLPDVDKQRMWVRSLAYILSTFNCDGMGLAPTNGFSGNPFPFNFVQDLFYIHPVLIASGYADIAKIWIEQFRKNLDDMKVYAKRLWGNVEGIFPPWELPYGTIEGYHMPSIPIEFCNQPQNTAYLSRMAHETGIVVNDPQWVQTNVVPLIRETARFYRSFCRKEEDGYWHLQLVPSIGQDEAGGRDQKDYLCVLYGAKYCFQRAIEYGLDPEGIYKIILEDGLAFPNLLSDTKFYFTTPNSGISDFGKQKHPVQLNGLAYLPVESSPICAEIKAHEQRYDITDRAKEPYFYGWTAGEFLLASSHLRDVKGWQKDWNHFKQSGITDVDFVQIYETSNATKQSFYITTHGLMAQSLYSNLVSDYWGPLAIAPCNVFSGPAQFGNIVSLTGVKVSGKITGSVAQIVLEAWKNCQIDTHGMQLKLNCGDRIELQLEV